MRFVRATIGIGLLVAIWLGFSVARNIAAQLSGRTAPPAAESTASADGGALVMKHTVAKTNESPLASDVRDAAGVILPEVPPEPQLVEYVGAVESPIVDIDAISDEFRNQTPESVVAGNEGGATGFRYSRPSPGGSFGGAAFGGVGGGNVVAGAAANTTESASESGSGDGRVHALDHQAGDTAIAREVPSETAAITASGGGTSVSSSGSGSGTSAGGPATGSTSPKAPSSDSTGSGVETASTQPTSTTVDNNASTPANANSPAAANAGATSAGLAAAESFALDVPEPAMLLLIGLGLAGVARRRQATRRV